MINKKAFTLTEVLIALVIIGAIGGLTLPSLLGNSNEKMFDTKYENTKQQIQHVVLEQMILHKTKQLADTDFSNVESVLGSATTIFDIVPRNCSIDGNCVEGTSWANGDGVLKYRTFTAEGESPSASPALCYIESDDAGTITLAKRAMWFLPGADALSTAVLKNGVLATYYYHSASGSGAFLFDLNNEDGPNINGKDTRGLVITAAGKIYDIDEAASSVSVASPCTFLGAPPEPDPGP